jgi:hypothetical protein
MAISASTSFNVRADGDDTNGGGFVAGASGTDYSLQAAAQVTYADMIVGPLNTQVSSVANPFTSAHVGNLINVTGGANFTTGRYQVVSVSGGVATLDRVVGIVDSVNGAGKLGGAILSPGIASAAVVASAVSDVIVHVKNGTYNCSSTANVAAGRVNCTVRSRWIGYNSVPFDLSGVSGFWSANMPSLKATSNSMTVFTLGANDISVENIELDGDRTNRSSTTGFAGSQRARLLNCRGKNMAGNAINPSGAGWDILFCEAVNCSAANAIAVIGVAIGCLSRDHVSSSSGFRMAASGCAAIGCVASNINGNGFSSQFPATFVGCVSVSNTTGFDADTAITLAVNCIAYNNTTDYSIPTSANAAQAILLACAGGTSPAGVPSGNKPGFVTLTADPFVDRTNRNFALNNTAGGGAALKALGFGSFPGSASTGYPDIGAVQTRGSALMSRGVLTGGRL